MNRLVQPNPTPVSNHANRRKQAEAISAVVLNKIIFTRLARAGIIQTTPDPVRELANFYQLLAGPSHLKWSVIEGEPKNTRSRRD